ncbi:TetR/AcrR family transcriptional regulator [Radiobacillus deserti]|uniref:TetR/AcrR family transcriptional regulator n=1 Tax=Radiobacillus deserti TaxID=2594883 RepID=A0A516KCF4_9BACI|nr:TetR/AcrR family transcriptional regulator [Radiobacillus deserti]QDP39091.1 TetR/AcrR family transcriptional regulator [Radiobacillus deserti]
MDERYIQQLLQQHDDDKKLTEKQARILIAAIEMFAKKGYFATSTSEIAKAASVAEGTIFRHYPSKKELLLAIVKPGVMKLAFPIFASDMASKIFDQEFQSLDSMLRTFIKNRMEFVEDNLPLVKILLQEIAFHDEIKEILGAAAHTYVLPRVKNLLDVCRKQNVVKDLPDETLLRFIITNVLGFIVTRYLVFPDRDWNDEQEVENVVKLIIDGLRPS